MADLRTVFRNIDPECEHEIACAGYTLESSKALLAERIDTGQADTLYHKAQPVAVIAWTAGGSYVETAFVATCTFFYPGVPSALFGRKYMRSLQRRLGGRPIIAHCYSRRENMQRWYALMGFEHIDSYNDRHSFLFECN